MKSRYIFFHSQFFCDKSIDVLISSLILSDMFSALTTVSSSSFFMTKRKRTFFLIKQFRLMKTLSHDRRERDVIFFFLESAQRTDTTSVESDVFLSLQSHEMRKLCLFMLFTSCLYLLSSVMLSVPTTPPSAPYTKPNLGAISCVGTSVLNLRACAAGPLQGCR